MTNFLILNKYWYTLSYQFCIYKFAFFLLRVLRLQVMPVSFNLDHPWVGALHLECLAPSTRLFLACILCLLPSLPSYLLGCSQPEDMSSFAVTPSVVALSLSDRCWRMKGDASALKPHPATILLKQPLAGSSPIFSPFSLLPMPSGHTAFTVTSQRMTSQGKLLLGVSGPNPSLVFATAYSVAPAGCSARLLVSMEPTIFSPLQTIFSWIPILLVPYILIQEEKCHLCLFFVHHSS